MDPLKEADMMLTSIKCLTDEEELVRVRFEFFRDVIVPNLMNDNKTDAVNKWAEIAGNQFKRVNLVDAEDNIVDVVPPLYDVSILIDDDRPDFMAGYSTASMIDEGSLDKSRVNRLLNNLNMKMDDKLIVGWQQLLYKYSHVETVKVEVEDEDDYDF